MGGSEMAVEVRGTRDEIVDQIEEVLEAYQKDHQQAKIAMYRQNSASVRIRIIDPDFGGMSKADRNDYVWNYLDRLSDDTQGDISMLVLLTPSEVKKSHANMEFEDPVPSML
jgi:stress-induced morphogen